jgi:flagellar biogenesis protein FliO
MKNENLKAIVGLVVAIALVVVMAYILKITNNI